jgi:D-serine deaminase-like pyridoxal phosphate-dependent protein
VTRSLETLETPALLLDRARLRRNLQSLAARMTSLGGVLRPHVKTHKSLDVYRESLAAGSVRGITVSTLREAEHFFEAGETDIFYAVGIAPNKIPAAASLIARGCDLKLTLDNLAQARCLAAAADELGVAFKVLIELDVDGQRAGVQPDGAALLEIGRFLAAQAGTRLQGVMTHAGGSYACDSPASLQAMARRERDLSLLAAERLRDAGLHCEHVSIGSTPTAFAIDDLDGVTEVRAGVYTLFDLVMAGIGVCGWDDIAASVLVSVTGHQPERQQVITDGGWMALSRDRGTAAQRTDYGYGMVVGADGRSLGDLIVTAASQEHGIVAPRVAGDAFDPLSLPVGSLLRVLPNHACATAGQFDRYHLTQGTSLIGEWPKINGW